MLSCTVNGKPSPRVIWKKNGVILQNSTQNTKYTISNAKLVDGGAYECNAVSPAGKDSKTTYLTVLGKRRLKLYLFHIWLLGRIYARITQFNSGTIDFPHPSTPYRAALPLQRQTYPIEYVHSHARTRARKHARTHARTHASMHARTQVRKHVSTHAPPPSSPLQSGLRSGYRGRGGGGSCFHFFVQTSSLPHSLKCIFSILPIIPSPDKPRGTTLITNVSHNAAVAGEAVAITCTTGGFPVPDCHLSHDVIDLSAPAPVTYVISNFSVKHEGTFQCNCTNTLGSEGTTADLITYGK